jgi:predicted N-acetyltransferase YhbS
MTWSPTRRWTPGEVAWSALTAREELDVVFVVDAMAWRNDDHVVVLAIGPSGLGAVIDWAAGSDVEVCDGDELLGAAVRDAGYAEVHDLPFSMAVHRATRSATGSNPPPGYELRAAREDDDLVAVHRASWLPSALPFADGHRPQFSPSAESTFTDDMLAKLQLTWPYRPDLHLVAEARDGSLVASCIVWLDDESGIASIEPLGVDPRHRRRGLGAALSRFAVREVARVGGTDVVIHPRGDAAYPIPLATYLKAGYSPAGRTRIFSR